MDLTTTYLGFKLSSPVMLGASPLTDNLDYVRRLEDGGAAAFVMRSLFEEQLASEQMGTFYATEATSDAHPEARSYFPSAEDFVLGPEAYLEQVRKIKEAVKVPVIGSLNGITASGWLDYAKQIVQAGADALELNFYFVATDPEEGPVQVEKRTLEIVRKVKAGVKVPVAVKLSPFFSALPHFVRQLEAAGADGIVLFNRFYEPDIDPVELAVAPVLHLSDSTELLLRLRWLAIVAPVVKGSLACSGGVHVAVDAVKAVMAGAHAVQVVSALLKNGPGQLQAIRSGMAKWMEDNEFASVTQMRGNMSLAKCPDARAFERGNYMRLLQSWRP